MSLADDEALELKTGLFLRIYYFCENFLKILLNPLSPLSGGNLRSLFFSLFYLGFFNFIFDMAGHSKWHSIRHKKAANDAKRGKVLTKHSKLLMVVAKSDPNPDNNPALRTAIANAKADGVPKDNIEKILKKMSGADKDSVQYSENVYEGFFGKIPVMVTSLTDNTNRAYTDIRTAFNKNGGNLGSSGSVSFMFDHVGVILVENVGKSEDTVMEWVMEAGGDNFVYGEEESEVITAFADLGAVRDALGEAGVVIKKSAPEYRAKDPIELRDEELEKLEKFLGVLEEVDDIDDVFVGV